MAGLAGIIGRRGQPAPIEQVRSMLETIQHRGPDGLDADAEGSAALGHAKLVLNEMERSQQQPAWLPDRSCGLVADARLYNREALRHELGRIDWLGDAPSDAALLLAAYLRWGELMLPRLRGDFAFVVWDGRKQCVFAARDPFGAKPLFYSQEADWFAFGSEEKALLCLPWVLDEIDEAVLAEYLEKRCTGRFPALSTSRSSDCAQATGCGPIPPTVVERYWPNPGEHRHVFRQR